MTRTTSTKRSLQYLTLRSQVFRGYSVMFAIYKMGEATVFRAVFKWLSKNQNETPTNHNRNKERDEPITIPSNYLKLAQSAGKITRTWRDWFWFCFSSAENWRESFKPITKCHVITFGSHLKTALLKLGKERFAAICSTRTVDVIL